VAFPIAPCHWRPNRSIPNRARCCARTLPKFR
jgi:hypothetical protein